MEEKVKKPLRIFPEELKQEDLIKFLLMNPYNPVYTVFQNEVVYKFMYLEGKELEVTNYLLPDAKLDPTIVHLKIDIIKNEGQKYFDPNDKFYTVPGIKKFLDANYPEMPAK